jgi:hypothetical protein
MGFRDSIPASLQEIVQNGLLERTFEDALVPLFLYDRLAELKPWAAQLGAKSIMTRGGLMTAVTAPITGSDASAASYGFEQYSVQMDQFGNSIDTNMAVSAMALASKFLEDNKTLGINAAQSLNLVAQGALYGAYGEGTTYATAASTASTTLDVADASGFLQAVANLSTTNSDPGEGLTGVATPTLVPVSGSTPLSVTVNGVANTVTGATVTTNHASDTLTLGTAVTASAGWAVVANSAPVQYRPNARASAYQLTSSDIATLSLFQSAVTRLRSQNVPPVGGAYTAHVAPQTVDELFQDTNFLLAYRGRADSSAYVNLTPGDSMGDNAEFMGRFAGIDWIMNTVTPNLTNPNSVPYWRPIVAGQDSLIKAPFERMGDLVSELNAGSTVQVDMVNGVARILRAPLDRLGQVLSSTWSWIGGYTVGTDLLTGDAAAYKRAVVLEHA